MFSYILPTTGRIRDFHPLERALAERTKKKAPAMQVLIFFRAKVLSATAFNGILNAND